MATFTELDQGQADFANTITSASFTPSNNSLIVVFVRASRDFNSEAFSWSISDTETLSWTQIGPTATLNSPASNQAMQASAWWAEVGTGASMTVTVDAFAANDGLYAMNIVEVTDYNTTTPIAQSDIDSSGSDGLTLGLTAPSEDQLAIWLWKLQSGSGVIDSPATGFAEVTSSKFETGPHHSVAWSSSTNTTGTLSATIDESGETLDNMAGLWIEFTDAEGLANAEAATATAQASDATTSAPPPSSDVKVQRGTATVSADGETTSLGVAVGSLDSAFLVITSNRHMGAGQSGSSAVLEGDDLSVSGYLSDTSTITWDRPATTPAFDTEVYWEVWEYVGDPAGDNEFIVRSRNEVTYTSALSQTATLDNTPTSIDACIPFLNGQVVNDTTDGYNGQAITAYLSGSDTLNIECGENDAIVKTTRVVTVEFTGSNWEVGHGILTAQTGDSGSVALVTAAAGTGGSSFSVTDWDTAVIASWGHKSDGTNLAIADHWPNFEPGADTSTVDYTFHSNHDGTDDDILVHVLRHPDLSVTRYSNTANTANGTNVDVTSAGLTDLERSSVLGTSTSSGNGTAHGRGWRIYRLTSLTNVEHWCHRSGNTMAHRIQVIDWVGITSTAAGSTTATATAATTTSGALDPSASVVTSAEAAGTAGQASDATVATATSTTAVAEAATTTSGADNPAVAVAPSAEVAGTVGQANDPGAGAAVNTDSAASTGQAADATISAASNATAETAATTGQAADAVPSIAPVAGTAGSLGIATDPGTALTGGAAVASATGTASDATISTTATTTAVAETATSTAAASEAVGLVAATAEPATSIGQAPDATVSTEAATVAAAETAAATSQATNPGIAATVPAEPATLAGNALDATVSTSSATIAAAGIATTTSQAADPSIAVDVTAEPAATTSSASDATAVTSSTAVAPAEVAETTGTAYDPVAAVAAGAETAAAAAVASQAAAQVSGATVATAETAGATTTADNPGAGAGTTAEPAVGAAQASDPGPGVQPSPGTATSTATAPNSGVGVAPGAGPATGTGQADDATTASTIAGEANAELVTVTGAAFDAVVVAVGGEPTAGAQSFLGMMATIRGDARTAVKETRAPTLCLVSAHRLEPDPNGGLICPFDGWKP